MEKKNNGLVIVLVLIILCLGGFILYDKNVFGLKGNNKDNTNNQEVNNTTTKDADENIKIGSIGNKESKVELIIDKDAYFNIKDGKVVFHKKDGTEIIDSTIPDKVIQIAGNLFETNCIKCSEIINNNELKECLKNGKIKKCQKCNFPYQPNILFDDQTMDKDLYQKISYQENYDVCFIIGSNLSGKLFSSILENLINKENWIIFINDSIFLYLRY